MSCKEAIGVAEEMKKKYGNELELKIKRYVVSGGVGANATI
jgi:hypothetical protein